jgi:hypothetical protein
MVPFAATVTLVEKFVGVLPCVSVSGVPVVPASRKPTALVSRRYAGSGLELTLQ